jgi:hypothetical protein
MKRRQFITLRGGAAGTVINAIKFSIEEIEALDQYFDHTGCVEQSGEDSRPRPFGKAR